MFLMISESGLYTGVLLLSSRTPFEIRRHSTSITSRSWNTSDEQWSVLIFQSSHQAIVPRHRNYYLLLQPHWESLIRQAIAPEPIRIQTFLMGTVGLTMLLGKCVRLSSIYSSALHILLPNLISVLAVFSVFQRICAQRNRIYMPDSQGRRICSSRVSSIILKFERGRNSFDRRCIVLNCLMIHLVSYVFTLIHSVQC